MTRQPGPDTDLAQAYLDIADVVIVAITSDERVSLVNRRGCEILGYRRPQDIIGRNWFDSFVPERMRGAVRVAFNELMQGRIDVAREFENPVLTVAGEERQILWRNSVLRGQNGQITGTLSSGTDVTDRRRAEAALRLTLKELEDLKYAINQANIVAITDPRGIIHYANDKFCEISKYSRAELLGQDHRIVNSGYHPKEFMRDLWKTIGSGRVWRSEIRNRAKDGTYYWVDTTIVPFLDERGKPYQYMAIRADITERKRAEALLREQETLAKLGEMAAVVAHEVKNPIAGIRGALQIIGGRLPTESRDRAVLGDVLKRLDALNETVRDLLLFARPRPPQLGPVELRSLIEATVALLKKDPELTQLNVEVSGEPVVVQADAELLKAVFLNILINAAQATSGAGPVRVDLGLMDGRCRVLVRDAGPGIPPEIREKIFEPFFSTKHRGSGLGLPVAKRIVESHHGAISVDSPAGGGTIVTIELPP